MLDILDRENEIINELIEALFSILKDEDSEEILEIKKKQYNYYKALVKKAVEEGFEVGAKIGFEQGMQQGEEEKNKQDIALKIFKIGMDFDNILDLKNQQI